MIADGESKAIEVASISSELKTRDSSVKPGLGAPKFDSSLIKVVKYYCSFIQGKCLNAYQKLEYI